MARVVKLGIKRPATKPLLPDPEPRKVDYTLISVDDHLMEPPHTFEGRLPQRLQDRAPRVIETEEGHEVCLAKETLLAPGQLCSEVFIVVRGVLRVTPSDEAVAASGQRKSTARKMLLNGPFTPTSSGWSQAVWLGGRNKRMSHRGSPSSYIRHTSTAATWAW